MFRQSEQKLYLVKRKHSVKTLNMHLFKEQSGRKTAGFKILINLV